MQRRAHRPEDFSKLKEQIEPGESCAYNQTRECFLGLHVVAGDLTVASFRERMTALKANSGAAMWLVPFRGISADDVTIPLDLLYLDADARVLEAVEFFPTFRVSSACPPAASVLVLPAHAIFSSQTQAGDQLILCPSDEMEWRLEQLARSGPLTGTAQSLYPRPVQTPALGPVLVRPLPEQAAAPVLIPDPPARPVAPPPVSQPVVSAEPGPAAAVPAVTAALAAQVLAPQAAQPVVEPVVESNLQPVSLEPVKPQKATAPGKPAKPWLDPSRTPAKSWLGKLILGEPSDPRAKARRRADGLVAHFFTGGAPQAHPVRDISTTGLYVITTERWYPGTVIRMTLSVAASDEHPTERSITVHAKSVRWGNDGVGLEFVLPESAKPSGNPDFAGSAVDKRHLLQFLDRHIAAGQ